VFRFANPWMLNFIWLLPVAALFMWWRSRDHLYRLHQFAGPRMASRLGSHNSRTKHLVSQFLLLAAGLFLTVAVARPQWALRESSASARGVDVFMIVDVSRSMDSADVKPSRLARAKRALFHMVDRMPENRLGVVAFAGVPFISCPLTRDRSALKLVIDSLSSSSLPVAGTDLGGAVEMALQSFKRTGARHSALVIITDGENFGRTPLSQIEQALETGVRTFCLGVGTPRGWPVPPLPGQADHAKSQPVMSRVNEKALKLFALHGSGIYQLLTPGGQEEEAVVAEIRKLEKIQLVSEEYQTWRDDYAIPALLACLCLLAELLIGQRRGFGWPWGWIRRWRKPAAAACVLLGLAMLPAAEALASNPQLTDRGVAAFKRRNFSLAEKSFDEARKAEPGDPLNDYNLGCAVLAQYRYQEALQAFQRARHLAEGELLRDVWYNLGYTAFYIGVKQGTPEQWQEALEAFKQCLLVDPHDDDARYNLELILREIQRHTQPSARKEQQSQGEKDGKNPGSGANQPGSDRAPSEARRNNQANPGEEEKPKTRRQDQGNQSTNSDKQQGRKQKGMSPNDALRTLKSLESEESSMQRELPVSNADQREYQGPDW